MQTTITKRGVDFEVEFTETGCIENIYIGCIEVSSIIRGSVEGDLLEEVRKNASRWFSEYRAELSDKMRSRGKGE